MGGVDYGGGRRPNMLVVRWCRCHGDVVQMLILKMTSVQTAGVAAVENPPEALGCDAACMSRMSVANGRGYPGAVRDRTSGLSNGEHGKHKPFATLHI